MATKDGADEAALERSYSVMQPIEVSAGEKLLAEAKQIFDEFGVVIFLRHGTCLGAIREKGFIPWDDDLDLGSVIGLHGFSEKSIDPVVAAFRGLGYFAKVEHNDYCISVTLMKSSIRTDWTCFRIIDDEIIHYPGVRIPLRLLTQLKEIDFAGQKFLVPNPPEEYLRVKYGEEWMIPKDKGYEKDIVEMVPDTFNPGKSRRLRQLVSNTVLRWRSTKIRILDHDGQSVSDADVRVAGVGRFRTNKLGYAKFNLPFSDWYAIVIGYGSHEEILYMERVAQGKTYVYRPDPLTDSGRLTALVEE